MARAFSRQKISMENVFIFAIVVIENYAGKNLYHQIQWMSSQMKSI